MQADACDKVSSRDGWYPLQILIATAQILSFLPRNRHLAGLAVARTIRICKKILSRSTATSTTGVTCSE